MRQESVIPLSSERLAKLPPYLFVQIDALKERLLREGRDIIDMGIGDPDRPTPGFILRAMVKALKDPRNHRYPSNRGLESFRIAISRWYKRRFQVTLDPDTEILPLIGSKEGIAHLPLALVNPGDKALIPDPGYPPYRSGTLLAGGRPVFVPLLKKNDFLPDLKSLRKKVQGARLFFLNYPNNPTTAVASLTFFKELVDFSRQTGVPICHDAAYSEITFEGPRHPSFLQAPGAKAVGVEFHSLSKTFNMTGWRVGFVCGNKRMISALAHVKSHIDSGIFQAVQIAGIRALEDAGKHVPRMCRLYKLRRDILVKALEKGGWPVRPPKATFYLWAPVPKGKGSEEVAAQLLKEAGVVATPGIGFGRYGQRYIRFSLSLPTGKLMEAARRIEKLSWPKRSFR